MWMKSIYRNRFLTRFFSVIYYKRNLISAVRYPQNEVKSVPLPAPKYFCFAFLNFLCFAQVQARADNTEKENGKPASVEAALSQSDELFKIGKFRDSWRVLIPFQDSNNAEVLWRLARGLYNLTKEKGIKNSEKVSLIKEAQKHIDWALSLDKNNSAVHKWMAIIYDANCDLNGMKARIEGLPVFERHLKKALELKPKDATLLHMLGLYKYNIADLSWFQRNIAKTLFATPPDANFEEAYNYFIKAEELEPNFYSKNLLMIGKTCLKLKKIEAARYWLKCAIAYPVKTDEDETVSFITFHKRCAEYSVRLEAEDLLKKHPSVNPAEHQEKRPDIQ